MHARACAAGRTCTRARAALVAAPAPATEKLQCYMRDTWTCVRYRRGKASGACARLDASRTFTGRCRARAPLGTKRGSHADAAAVAGGAGGAGSNGVLPSGMGAAPREMPPWWLPWQWSYVSSQVQPVPSTWRRWDISRSENQRRHVRSWQRRMSPRGAVPESHKESLYAYLSHSGKLHRWRWLAASGRERRQ